jgi:phosphatidylinositol kinase/protein kinase (PI-3  family)
MKKNHLQFTFDSTFNFQQMLKSLEWCIYQNNCSLTQYSYLELLYNIHCQIPSNELINSINEYINYMLKNGDKVTIGSDDLTRILTRLIIHLENVSVQHKLFVFVEQTRTELCFVETILLENNLSLFENNLRQWIIDLLLTMDLFNEQLYTKSCELLLKILDKTINYQRLTRRIVQLIDQLRR